MKTVPLTILVPEGEYCDACYYLEEIAYCNLFNRTLKCKVNKRIKCKACKDRIAERNAYSCIKKIVKGIKG